MKSFKLIALYIFKPILHALEKIGGDKASLLVMRHVKKSTGEWDHDFDKFQEVYNLALSIILYSITLNKTYLRNYVQKKSLDLFM